MKKALLYFLTKRRLRSEGRNIKDKCERDAIALIHELGGKDSDIETLFHYVYEVLYLFGVGALDINYAVDRKLYTFFSKYSRTEAEQFFAHPDFDKYEPSEFIVLAAYAIQKASEIKNLRFSFIGNSTSVEKIDIQKPIQQIIEEVQILASKVFPEVQDKLKFFNCYFARNYTLFLPMIRKNVEQKTTYRKK